MKVSDATFDSPKLLLMFIGISIACIVWCIKGFKAGIFRKTKGVNLAILIYLSSCIASCFLGLNWVVSFFGAHKQCGGVLTLIVYLAVFYLSANYINKRNMIIIFRFLVITGILCCIYGVCVQACVISFDSLPFSPRCYSVFGNPVFFACFIAMMIPIVFYELYRTKQIYLYLVLILFIFCLFKTQTRSGLISIALITIPLLFMYRNDKVFIVPVLSLFAIILISGIYISEESFGIHSLCSRFTHSHNYATRLNLYVSSLSAINAYPIFGIGQDNIRPHNILIGHCAKLGIIGLLAFLYLGYSSLRSFIFSEYEDLKLFYTLLGTCCAYLIFRQFNPGYIPITLFFSMVAGSLYGIKNNNY